MTNKQAINILLNEQKCIDRNDSVQCDRKCGSCDLVMDVETIREAYSMAVSALRAQDVSDTNVGNMISRQWMIDELKRYFHDEYYQRTSIQDCIDCFIEDILTKLPFALPEPSACWACNCPKMQLLEKDTTFGKWVPCSERPPEEDKPVFVYLFYDSPYIAWVCEGRWYTEEFMLDKDDEPTAWMPLPERYSGE